MQPKFALALLLLLLPIHAVGATTTTATESSVGTAYGLESGDVLYTEHHHETWENGRLVRCDVEYRDPSGMTFATKTLRFPAEAATPEFEMLDRRDGYREGADLRGGAVALYGGSGSEVDAESVQLPEDAVIDAGFHRFIQGRLDELRSGRKVTFQFAVPSQKRFIGFRLAPERRSPTGAGMTLVMEPSNPFLRFLVDPVELTYDADGRLREFRGLSNIRDGSGNQHEARIVFRYAGETTDGRS